LNIREFGHRGIEQILHAEQKAGGGGYHPRGDRKSAEATENARDIWLPLRKRVCNPMIMLGLQGCDKKQRTCEVLSR